jgi:hypothetical protein
MVYPFFHIPPGTEKAGVLYYLNIGWAGKKLSFAAIAGKGALATMPPDKGKRGQIVALPRAVHPYRKRRGYHQNRAQAGKNARLMEQGGVNDAGCCLRGNPFFGKAVYGGVDNGFQFGQGFRVAKNKLSQESAVYLIAV